MRWVLLEGGGSRVRCCVMERCHTQSRLLEDQLSGLGLYVGFSGNGS